MPAARGGSPEHRQGPSRLHRRDCQRLSLLVERTPSWRCNPKLPLVLFHSMLRVSKQETGVHSCCWPFSCSFCLYSGRGQPIYTNSDRIYMIRPGFTCKFCLLIDPGREPVYCINNETG